MNKRWYMNIVSYVDIVVLKVTTSKKEEESENK